MIATALLLILVGLACILAVIVIAHLCRPTAPPTTPCEVCQGRAVLADGHGDWWACGRCSGTGEAQVLEP